MKIFVITGSHRPGSNSTILAENFIKGATEAGHSCELFPAAKKNVHACIGCCECEKTRHCIFDDDFTAVRDKFLEADLVVFATPMYYFGFSSQIRKVIDRFYAMDAICHGGKKAVLLVSSGGSDLATAKSIESGYELMLDYLDWKDMGRVLAPGVHLERAVEGTRYPADAYELGKKI